MKDEIKKTAHLNFLQGRALVLNTQGALRMHLGDFHDIVCLAMYGESVENLDHLIKIRCEIPVQ